MYKDSIRQAMEYLAQDPKTVFVGYNVKYGSKANVIPPADPKKVAPAGAAPNEAVNPYSPNDGLKGVDDPPNSEPPVTDPSGLPAISESMPRTM